MENIDERLKNVMSVVFEVPAESINQDSSQDSIEKWESLRHLNLILALEEEFDVEIPDEEVGNLMNFKLIRLVISELKEAK